MATIIFENQAAFEKREVMEDNGVTQDCLDVVYDGSLQDYEAANTGNTSCFNMVDSTNCTKCVECTNSTDLIKCNYCVECTNSEELNNCSNCENSSLLENCDNMESSTDCKNCNFCIDAEGLVEESFIRGETSEDEDTEGDSATPPISVGAGTSGAGSGSINDALDVFGNLDNVNIGG